MRAGEAWGAFTVLFVLALATVSAMLVASGEEAYFVVPFAAVVMSVYLYIVYKRYHVELVPEADLRLFDDPEDLRILCAIYGLGRDGKPPVLRHRLARLARANPDASFIWVAPKATQAVASALRIGPAEEEELPEDLHEFVTRIISDKRPASAASRPLVWGRSRSKARLHSLSSCPVCSAPAERTDAVCRECGADMEFYEVFSESKVGRRLVAEKARETRRKLRYPVPHLGDR